MIFIQRNYYRAGNSRNPSGGSSNGSNNPGGLPPQFVQVEMTNPDDQQFIVYRMSQVSLSVPKYLLAENLLSKSY